MHPLPENPRTFFADTFKDRRVDAVDFSARMIERGRQLPGGDSPRLRWIYGKVEEVPLAPPYALIAAGSSIHSVDLLLCLVEGCCLRIAIEIHPTSETR